MPNLEAPLKDFGPAGGLEPLSDVELIGLLIYGLEHHHRCALRMNGPRSKCTCRRAEIQTAWKRLVKRHQSEIVSGRTNG